MNRPIKLAAFSCLISLATSSFAPSALAFKVSTGAIAGQKKLMKGVGESENDLSFSPMLLEMAKLIGRTGITPGFFLTNEGPMVDEPGVDLRSLLLWQAGLIKMPARFTAGRKMPADASQLPTLVLQNLPDPRAGSSETVKVDRLPADGVSGPTLASEPMPREPEPVQVIAPKRNVGNSDKIKIAASDRKDARPAESPLVSLDISKLQADLQVFGDDTHADTVRATMPQLAMTMPRTNVMPFITKNAFRLWTFREDGKPYAAQTAGSAPSVEFNGTFIVSTTGAIKSITGRHFVLRPGKLLACNQGGELLFQTPLASVSVDPDATAVMEISEHAGAQLVKIYALETLSASAVVVTLPGNKPQTINLTAGEELVIANHPLLSTDLQGTLQAKKLTANAAKVSFSVHDFFERELIASPQARATDAEHFSALSALKKRVGDKE